MSSLFPENGGWRGVLRDGFENHCLSFLFEFGFGRLAIFDFRADFPGIGRLGVGDGGRVVEECSLECGGARLLDPDGKGVL